MCRSDPASAPAVTSLWPFRYFVALCMTRSTPSAIGCWLIGLANVLSITDSTPRARQADAIAAMSTHRSVGLIGDSNQRSFVSRAKSVSGWRQLVELDEPRPDAEPCGGSRPAGAACRRRSPRCTRSRRPPPAIRAAPSSSPPDRSKAPARARRPRAPRSSARRRRPSGSRIASRGTSASALRCSRALPARSRTGTSSSRRSASSAAPHRG